MFITDLDGTGGKSGATALAARKTKVPMRLAIAACGKL
jgi:hypothetical protein